MSGELDHIPMTAGGWSFDQANALAGVDVYLSEYGLNFQLPEGLGGLAQFQAWLPPVVKAYAQKILRLNWIAWEDLHDNGFAAVLLIVGVWTETDAAFAAEDAMYLEIELPAYNPDAISMQTIDIDITDRIDALDPNTPSHVSVELCRVPYEGAEEPVVNTDLVLMAARIISDLEPSTPLPWVPLPV